MDYTYCEKYFDKVIEETNPIFEADFRLLENKGACSLCEYIDSTEFFIGDLIMIDSKMPEILANIALGEFAIQNKIKKDNFLEHKIKDFLMYVFFNSTPEKIIFSNYGDKGFIALKNNKEILHFPSYNLSEFRNALLLRAGFDSTLHVNQKEKSKGLKLKVTFKNNPVL